MGHWTRTLAPTGWTFSDAPEAGQAFWSGSQNILLGFTTEKVRVCSFLGSQCSHLSASYCSLPISIHMEGHSSYRLSTFATRSKVFNTSGGKVERHVGINNSLRRFVNN